MSSFAQLKANSASSIQKLVAAAEKLSTGKKNYGDDRFWTPTVDKAGNGYAVLRFLPAPSGEDLPYVRYWDHGFKGPTGRWYIENSLTSIGLTDPVSELNTKLWNSGNEDDKATVRDRKRRLHYVVNVLVVSDPGNPANDGKVFLWKFGKKIFDKIMDIMQPQFADEAPVNPFDFWAGANFKLKIRNVEGYRNYDKSEFDRVSELFPGADSSKEDIYNGLHSLKDFTDAKNYKTYAELKKKLYEVIGEAGVITDVGDERAAELNETAPSRSERNPVMEAKSSPSISTDSGDDDDDDDDDSASHSYFAKLAKS
jgi:hypothetical protein